MVEMVTVRYERIRGARRRVWQGVVGVAALGALLSGCTAGGDPDDANSPAVETGSTVDTADPGDTGVSVSESDLVNARGAAAWLSGFTCSPDETGVWNASGKVTNPGDSPAKVLVTASVVDGATFSVQGSGTFVYDVEPQGTVDVTVPGVFTDADGRTDLDCVSRVVAGDTTG